MPYLHEPGEFGWAVGGRGRAALILDDGVLAVLRLEVPVPLEAVPVLLGVGQLPRRDFVHHDAKAVCVHHPLE